MDAAVALDGRRGDQLWLATTQGAIIASTSHTRAPLVHLRTGTPTIPLEANIYGAPRIFLDLREAGETCSKHRVARRIASSGQRGGMKTAKAKRAGRPPAGIDGKPSSEYPQLAVRVPPQSLRQVAEIAAARDVLQWQVICEAVARFHRQAVRRPRRG